MSVLLLRNNKLLLNDLGKAKLDTSSGDLCCCSSSSSSTSSSGGEPTCGICTGTVPEELQVVLGGFLRSGVGGDCASILDGTWVLSWIGNCQWQSAPYQLPCNSAPTTGHITLDLLGSGGNAEVIITVDTGDVIEVGPGSHNFGKAFSSPPDCNSWSDTVVPWTGTSGSGSCCNDVGFPVPDPNPDDILLTSL